MAKNSKTKLEDIKDNIVQVDSREQYNRDMVRYSIYVLMSRYVPNIADGLKPVQRRILTSMYFDLGSISYATRRKSAKITGNVIGDYHPHGDGCLSGDTIVCGLDGKIYTLEELYNKGENFTIEVYCVDSENNTIDHGIIRDIRIGQYTDTIYHIELSNGYEIKATSNHPFLLENGEYHRADELHVSDALFSISNLFKDVSFSSKIYIQNISVEILDEKVPMYDFTEDVNHNMLIPIGDDEFICAHNSVYNAMKPMVNWFESKMPLLSNISQFGNLQGDPASAPRYTETCISPFGMECVIGDLAESEKVVDWVPNFDRTKKEPEALATKVPLLLINGVFSIAVGTKIEVPSHNLGEVIDATIALLDNPNAKVVLIPDPPMACEIVDTNWKQISNSGYGKYIVRGHIDTIKDDKTGVYTLCIKSVPELVFTNSVKEKIEELIVSKKLIQIDDIVDASTDDQCDLRLVLKPGSDPDYVKQVIYNNTPVQVSQRVNMEVLVGLDIQRISYKAYLVYFLEFRRDIKFRLYNHRLQKVETRLHKLDVYLKILSSDDVDGVIKMIRNQNNMDENYVIEWLVKKLNVTDLQAKSILHTEIRQLSKAHYNKYLAEYKELLAKVDDYIKMITHPELIDKEIREELLEIKKKYGQPRKSIIIKKSDIDNIPSGEFKIVITEANFVKKMQITDQIKSFKGDNAKCVIIADNTKDLLLFDEQGRVFKLPVHKIAFTDKNSPGIDIRLLLPKLTSNIRTIMYAPVVEELANKVSKCFIVTVTTKGMIKRMDLNDIITATPSGIIYSKLNPGDSVKDIIIAGGKNDIVVYTKSKAIRLSMNQIPYLKRATVGNKALSTNDDVDGLAVVTQDTTDIVIITNKGYVNRFSINGLQPKARAKAPDKVIRLTKGDTINAIFSCNPSKNKIRVISNEGSIDVNLDDIAVGSSISGGTKMFKNGVIKCELLRL